MRDLLRNADAWQTTTVNGAPFPPAFTRSSPGFHGEVGEQETDGGAGGLYGNSRNF
ncbi:hypothetical protein STRIP9103_05270 [Streptomyces ipomoeae 91-03]|uniref:Uncharacterized protein n=1 Tax=Streptomyces ipomoeae 91-03 TaxID=698759 RepID=L1KVK6_9ACTN|nr:hypothetical protein STRIP9103_05270 [Streptomyces ipomoeae 91-03]